MEINYEKARLSDYEEIYTVMQTSARELSRKAYSDQLKDTFDKFYIDKTPDYIKQTLENQHSYTIVAKIRDRIIGFIQITFQNKIGNISHLYILPGYEGNAIGTNLFGFVKERSVQLNMTKVYIESTLNALSYYEKLGFVNKGLIPDESAYHLELELKS
jgi:N-acetylglutamate synthase-like GNAT family acetyltransferase